MAIDLKDLMEKKAMIESEMAEKMAEIYKDTLEPALQHLEDSGIKAIYIQGYTPVFNDGDPCTHEVYCIDDSIEIFCEDEYNVLESFKVTDRDDELRLAINEVEMEKVDRLPYVPYNLRDDAWKKANKEANKKRDIAYNRYKEEIENVLSRYGILNEKKEDSGDLFKVIEEFILPSIEKNRPTNYHVLICPGSDTPIQVDDYECGH